MMDSGTHRNSYRDSTATSKHLEYMASPNIRFLLNHRRFFDLESRYNLIQLRPPNLEESRAMSRIDRGLLIVIILWPYNSLSSCAPWICHEPLHPVGDDAPLRLRPAGPATGPRRYTSIAGSVSIMESKAMSRLDIDFFVGCMWGSHESPGIHVLWACQKH